MKGKKPIEIFMLQEFPIFIETLQQFSVFADIGLWDRIQRKLSVAGHISGSPW